MKRVHLDAVTKATGGQVLKLVDSEFSGIATDTRKSMKQNLFWALRGENFDGHAFVSQAILQGATGILIEHESARTLDLPHFPITVISVENTQRALQDLAHSFRLSESYQVLAVTGSNGKTTTKEFLKQIFSQFYKVHSPPGSFNNHFGLPFHLLATPLGTEIVIAEMGMDHAGEIQRLCEIAEPDSAAVTMVGRAHIENFGSSEKIAEAKNEIYQYARPRAHRIYNLDNPYTRQMFTRHAELYPRSRAIRCSSDDPQAEVRLKADQMTVQGLRVSGHLAGIQGEVVVPVFGSQNIVNLQIAAGFALAYEISPEQIWRALPKCGLVWGRNQFVRTQNGAQILFDAYNANPESMKSLFDNVRTLQKKGPWIAVIGEMLALGKMSAGEHEALGQIVGRLPFDEICFFGEHHGDFQRGIEDAGYKKSIIVSSAYEADLAQKVSGVLEPDSFCVVKGSRGMGLERFVELCRPLDFRKE